MTQLPQHQPVYTSQPVSDIRMVRIPAGSFLMGSPLGAIETPQHSVSLDAFWMSQTPITQAQWRAVARWKEQEGERWGRKLNPSPSRFSNQSDSDQRPVEQVSWFEAMEFCNRLSQRSGRHYTLPSEAQWEYACRAGTSTPFHFGATLTADLANYNATETYDGGPKGVYRKQTTPVGMFPANAWGLHDLHGNVWEWCLDHWHDSYEGAPADGNAWLDADATKAGEDQKRRLLRGGSWLSNPGYCRSAYRNLSEPYRANDVVGLRVVCLPQHGDGLEQWAALAARVEDLEARDREDADAWTGVRRTNAELRARVKALEEQVVECNYQHRKRIVALEARVTCPHIASSDEGTSYCRLAEQVAAAAPPEPAPAGSLVERVGHVIASADEECFDTIRRALERLQELEEQQ